MNKTAILHQAANPFGSLTNNKPAPTLRLVKPVKLDIRDWQVAIYKACFMEHHDVYMEGALSHLKHNTGLQRVPELYRL